MKKASATPTNIDEYIAASPLAVRSILRELRRIAREAAPDAEEVISYRMPAFRLNGILIYFAAFKHHIGLFPPVSGDAKLEKALAPYAGPKGNLRFPLDQAIPYGLVQRIVKLKMKQNFSKVMANTTSRAPARKVSPSKTRRRKRMRAPLTARA